MSDTDTAVSDGMLVAERHEPELTGTQKIGAAWRRQYTLRRILKSLLTLWLVITATFFLLRAMPGDPIDAKVSQLQSEQGLSRQEALNQVSSLLAYDPDEPVFKQYGEYMSKLVRGDMGESLVSPGTKVTKYVFTYLPYTLFSVGLGLLIAFVLGIALGVLIAYRRGGFLDHAITNLSSFIHAIPNYFWAIITIVVFGVTLHWFEVTDIRGAHSPGVNPSFSFEFLSDVMYHAALPVTIYALTSVGSWIIVMKSSTTQVLDEDFVTVAKARGLKEGRIRAQYVGRNAILPLFTQFALAAAGVVGGSTLVETIFQYEGVGYFFFDAIKGRDYPVMQGFILVMSIVTIACNLIADLLLSRIDPRIRTEGSEA